MLFLNNVKIKLFHCHCQLFCSAWVCSLEDFLNICNSKVFCVVNMYLHHLSYVLCVLIAECISVMLSLTSGMSQDSYIYRSPG